MEIDRPTPEHIRDSPEPFDNMFADLTDFTDKIGGKLWRDEKIHKISFERSVAIIPDELPLSKLNHPIDNFNDTNQPQEITIRLEVEREMFDDGYYYKLYDIVYLTETLVHLEDMPAEYQVEFNEELSFYNEENDTQIKADNMLSIYEKHVHAYTIDEEDDTISYSEYITYNWAGNIEIDGEEFHSLNEREIVHGQGVDDFAFELGQYKDQIESTDCNPETIIYDHEFDEITSQNGDIEMLFHSEDDHARRVSAIVDLLGSGLFNN